MKKTIIILVPLIVVILIAYSFIKKNGQGPEYVLARAERGVVTQTVDATGSISSAEEIALNFKTTGRIKEVFVKSGDQVTLGQVLAALESSGLLIKIADAEADLLEARANLEKILAGTNPEDIRLKKITVEQKEQSLDAEKNNLASLSLKETTELKNLRATVVVTIKNEIITVQEALRVIDKTLNDDDARNTLGVLENGAVERALGNYNTALLLFDEAEAVAETLNNASTDAGVSNSLDKAEEALTATRRALSETFNVLKKTITSQELSQSELDALFSGITTEQSSVSSGQSSLQTAGANWSNKKVYYADLKNQSEDNIKAAEQSLELARADLEKSQADPKDYEITAGQARVAKAEANLSLNRNNLSDTFIIAPIAGTITEVTGKIGEQTALSAPVLKMIGQSALEIEVDIPESDIAKIAVGQSATITLDSFGDNRLFKGRVTFMNPAETVIQDVVYYQVKIQFEELDREIKPGMTANVTINTAQKDNVIRLPLRAVRQKNGDKVVEILSGDKVEEKKVLVGLKGDDYYEISEGLQESEEVITFIKEKK